MSESARTVLITGASSGIGRAIAIEYARRGAHVLVTARREPELASLCESIGRSGGKASYLVCDVADARAAEAMVKEAEKKLGSLDVVIANAGVGGSGHASRMRVQDIEAMINVNVTGAMATLAAAIPIMLAQQRGQLVGVSSLAGRRAVPMSAIYSASKAALSTFLEGVRIDLVSSGARDIVVTDVQPGFVATPLTDKNEFRMPFIWPVERAAAYIVDRLERGRGGVVAFPIPLRFLTRLSQLLPFRVHAFATTRFTGRH